MDLAIADVTGLPEDAVRPGARAELSPSAEVAIDDFAARSGTIGHQVLFEPGAIGGTRSRFWRDGFKFARIVNWRNSWACRRRKAVGVFTRNMPPSRDRRGCALGKPLLRLKIVSLSVQPPIRLHC